MTFASALARWPYEAIRLIDRECAATSDNQVAATLGTTKFTIFKWRKGQKPKSHIRNLSLEAYGIPLAAWDALPTPELLGASREEMLAAQCIDQGFVHFLVNGHPQFTATLQQQTMARVVLDDVDPCDLHGIEREHARRLFGDGVETIPASARRVAAVRLGRESAKSTMLAAWSVWRLLTCDLSKIGHNTMPTVVFFSADAETAATIFDMACCFLADVKLDKEQKEKNTAQSIIFKRPSDDRRVRLQLIVRSVGGVRGRGIPIVGAVVDEAEFLGAARADAVIQDEAVIGALKPRLTAGGKIVLLSTPWEAESYAGALFAANFGHPKNALAAFGPTVFMRDGAPDVVARRAELLETDPKLVAREFDCEVVSMADALVDDEYIYSAIQRGKHVVRSRTRVCCGFDVGFRKDRSSQIITERQGNLLCVVQVEELIPQRGRPLVPEDVFRRFAETVRESGGSHMLAADAYEAESARRGGREAGISVGVIENRPEAAHLYLRDLFVNGRIAIPDDERLIAQLRATRTKAKPGGGIAFLRVRSPKLGHCDLSSALVAAAWADKMHHGEVSSDRAVGLAHYPRRVVGVVPTDESSHSTTGTTRSFGRKNFGFAT